MIIRTILHHTTGGSTNSSRGVRIQVRGNFHILTKQQQKTRKRGVTPLPPPPLYPPLHHHGTTLACHVLRVPAPAFYSCAIVQNAGPLSACLPLYRRPRGVWLTTRWEPHPVNVRLQARDVNRTLINLQMTHAH